MSDSDGSLWKFLKEKNSLHLLILGYFLITLSGCLLLCLPFSQKIRTPWIDHLFVSMSALSTTGLSTVSVADTYTFWGQLVIVLLIQVGGIGYMTFGSYILLMSAQKISYSQKNLLKTQFGLPDHLNLNHFIQTVVYYSLIVEFVGALFFYFIFESRGIPDAFWQAIFHSISSFCTAGFSLFNNSFEDFYNHPLLNIVICVLSLLGAMGFLIVMDVLDVFRKKKKQITYTSKLILSFTTAVAVGGTAVIFFTDPNLFSMPLMDRFWIAFFQCVSASTTVGFDSYPISKLSSHVIYLLSILMVLGASPAGTGGGIKSTTIIAAWAQMVSTFSGKKETTFYGRVIPDYRMRWANTSISFYILILCLGIFFLEASENIGFFELLFEASSALGTVGLSLGITPSLSLIGKWIIIVLMFIGRVGPLSLGMAVFMPQKSKNFHPEEDVIL